MSESFSAFGSRVHTPCGPRKSGMPESVEIPAPVRTTTRCARSIQSRRMSVVGLLMGRGDSLLVARYSLLVPCFASLVLVIHCSFALARDCRGQPVTSND